MEPWQHLLQKNAGNYSAYGDWNASLAGAYAADLKATDRFGNASRTARIWYNPMYYLTGSDEGYRTSNPAPHWRIGAGSSRGTRP